jgi:hypothetical protein
MKKVIALLFAAMIFLVGCGASEAEVKMETVPNYVDGETSPIELSVTENGGAAEGLEIIATLEMARMDHGIIEVVFVDNGNGIYSGEVELPMGGEWIMDTQIDSDGSVQEEVITFDVSEG